MSRGHYDTVSVMMKNANGENVLVVMETIRNGKRRNGCSWDGTLSDWPWRRLGYEGSLASELAVMKERTHDTC